MTSGKLTDNNKIAWLKLAGFSWLGATIKAGLIKEFGTPEKIFSATKTQLAKVKGWNFQKLNRFVDEIALAQPICSLEDLQSSESRLITFNDDDYPPLLREIPDSPIVLFSKGNIELMNKPTIAIVGARKATQLGYDIARDFSRELAKAGFSIISGLALGIDTYAHRGALEANGHTVAVLGCGTDIIYPKSNARMRERMLKNGGGILSEYHPTLPARPWHFPVRNRIISGSSIGTLVVEASIRSGSLITARLAAEQNREVFAIPGSIRAKSSAGTLNLIREGATLVTDPSEIIEYFSDLLPEKIQKDEFAPSENLNKEEIKLVNLLSIEAMSLDKLLEASGFKRDRLFSLLLTLEMRDYLVRLPGNFYQKKKKLTA